MAVEDVGLEELHQRRVYQLIARLAGDVAPDELAVHADALAGDVQHLHLLASDLLENLLHQVYARLLLVLADAAAEQVPSVYRGSRVVKVLQAKGLAREHVEVALLEQLLVAAAEALLQRGHGHKDTDGGIGAAALLANREQNLKLTLVNLGGHKAEKHVLPSLWVGVLLRGTVAQLHHGRCKHIELGIPFGLLEHIGQVVDSPYKGTKNIPHISRERHIYIIITVD